MTYQAEEQIVKALRSLPWYMFLVPALFTLFMLLFNPSVLTDMRPEYTWWTSCGSLREWASSFGYFGNCRHRYLPPYHFRPVAAPPDWHTWMCRPEEVRQSKTCLPGNFE